MIPIHYKIEITKVLEEILFSLKISFHENANWSVSFVERKNTILGDITKKYELEVVKLASHPFFPIGWANSYVVPQSKIMELTSDLVSGNLPDRIEVKQ